MIDSPSAIHISLGIPLRSAHTASWKKAVRLRKTRSRSEWLRSYRHRSRQALRRALGRTGPITSGGFES